jgi:predicted nucleic acid-binding protein
MGVTVQAGSSSAPSGSLSAQDRFLIEKTEEAIRDFYLNNVLIHELGHILDSRNSSPRDRERFAEWFALEVGYKASRRKELAQQTVNKYVVKRHGRA